MPPKKDFETFHLFNKIINFFLGDTMWEMPPIFNNQGPNQQQNQPPHFNNPMNDPLGINSSQNGPPGPAHGHPAPHPGPASGGGHHAAPGPDRGKNFTFHSKTQY